ncbi:MAG TPA: 50S ribosomal protein L11 methyltransferase [Virgibacillus sp.]|nr:50S ribosomal protein L11 methyltransferase [Virgibacillus sp.]
MNWSEVCIHTTHEAMEPVTNTLQELHYGGVVIEDPLDISKQRDSIFGEIYEIDRNKYPSEGIFIKVYLLMDDQLEANIAEIKDSIDQLASYGIDLGENKLTCHEVKAEDWETSWKKYYKPVKVSPHITVVPSWEDYVPETEKEVMIKLDPGMAFGTGTHPTTMLSIQALEKTLVKNDVVIDVGCGSGVLSIASGLLGARKVNAYDLDEVAISSTRENVDMNDLTDKVMAQQNNLLDHVNKQADVIVANILAEIIIKFTKEAWNNLKQGGHFITSGIIKDKQELVEQSLVEVGFQTIEINEMNNWICIIAKKV